MGIKSGIESQDQDLESRSLKELNGALARTLNEAQKLVMHMLLHDKRSAAEAAAILYAGWRVIDTVARQEPSSAETYSVIMQVMTHKFDKAPATADEIVKSALLPSSQGEAP